MSDSVLVIGAGLGGMASALHLAARNTKVVLVERGPILGGRLASRLGEDLARNDQIPKPSDVLDHDNIEVLTLSDVVELKEKDRTFSVSIRQRVRFVTDACTLCNKCRYVCPVVVPNEFEEDLAYRKAIFAPIKDGVPNPYVIDINDCLNDPPNYLPCHRCVEVCEDNAIRFDVPLDETIERNVGAVIVAVGYGSAHRRPSLKYSYGTHPDIVTSLELEHLLRASGPTGGFLEKPSNEECPESVIIIMEQASALAWSYTASHVRRLIEQDVSNLTILYCPEDVPDGTELPSFNDEGVECVKGEVEKIHEVHDNTLRVRYRDTQRQRAVTQEYDMVVISTPVEPSEGLPNLARVLGIGIGTTGFVKIDAATGGFLTNRPQIYATGCAAGPANMEETCQNARRAADGLLERRIKPVIAREAERTPATKGLKINENWLTEEELYNRLQQFVESVVALGNGSQDSQAVGAPLERPAE